MTQASRPACWHDMTHCWLLARNRKGCLNISVVPRQTHFVRIWRNTPQVWGMSSKLRFEVRSYQLVNIDDTWAEAVHRDVSNAARSQPGANAPYICASLRTGATLASLDEMTPMEVLRFQSHVRRYRSIAHRVPGQARRLTTPKFRSHEDVVGMVYRCDATSLRHWGAELGSVVQVLPERPIIRQQVSNRLKA